MSFAVSTSDFFLKHETGSSHPESKERLTSIIQKLERTEYYSKLLKLDPREATKEEISLIHEISYIHSFEKKAKQGSGYFDADTPYSEDSYKAACLAVGAGLELADAIIDKKIKTGMAILRPPGHHAEREHAMGFCMFNNIAITAKYLQSKGLKKILILDWDVHHGNGTENSFYEDDTVFFLSTHQYPFYPGTGSEKDIGAGKGLGYNLNIPMQRDSIDSDYKNIFKENIIPAIDKFMPDIILISAGFDAHKEDPLGGINLTTSGFEMMTEIIKQKAEELCGGKMISFLEGGYNLQALAESVEAHISVLKG
jgi:acetoin utilization deacetylase AcuC-like enzyme